MDHLQDHYIDGAWVPASGKLVDVVNPATEKPICQIRLGTPEDVDVAVTAARRAFATYPETTRQERIALLKRIVEIYDRRTGELAATVTAEVGAPITFSRDAQIYYARCHFTKMIELLDTFSFNSMRGTTAVALEPVGVCGLVTPWNWPLNEIIKKVAPALAAGCCVVLKPSEVAPLNAILLAEILHEAGVPAGAFNMVQGSGDIVGNAMSSHPDIDMMSFTGSTRAGILVAKNAAETVKRVHQELGGKSAHIILPDADFSSAVAAGVHGCFGNAGQSCSAPTRMLVPHDRMEEATRIAVDVALSYKLGDPESSHVTMGPVVSKIQFDRVQHLIASGISEGATVAIGGVDRPANIETGYFVQPTIFSHVKPDMTIAREEIFGPVLSIIGYDTEDEAVSIANDSRYGLAGYVDSADLERARGVARRLRAGCIFINTPEWDAGAPFGGYKQSGNGREYGEFGLEAFLEIKGMVGYGA